MMMGHPEPGKHLLSGLRYRHLQKTWAFKVASQIPLM